LRSKECCQIEALRRYWQLQWPDAVVVPTCGSNVDDRQHAQLVKLTFSLRDPPRPIPLQSLSRHVQRTISMSGPVPDGRPGTMESTRNPFDSMPCSTMTAYSEVQESLVRSPTRRRSCSTQSTNLKKHDNIDKNKGSNAAIATTTTGTTTAGARTSIMEEKICDKIRRQHGQLQRR
jgi:hypothetical protein